MNKHTFEYIFSGTGFLRFPNRKLVDSNDEMLKYYPMVFEWAHEQNKKMENFNFEYGLLCNAYTQRGESEIISKAEYHGADHFYLDSGGLQIVTTGNKIDDNMKNQIYKTQMLGDFGFCFDEIPLIKEDVKIIKMKGKSKYLQNNSRTDISDKLYVVENKTESGKKTGRNIEQQINAFKENNKATKAIIILQGNQTQDMVDFFYDALSEISEDNYDQIGAIALADTCMGNDILESCDMMAAWRKLYEDTNYPFVHNHVHLLGVGSLSRFIPYLCFAKTNFIPPETKYSSDSTTHSIAYHVGFYKGSSYIRYDSVRSPVNEMLFGRVYDEFEHIISDFFTKEQYIDYFCDRIHSFSTQKKETENERMKNFVNLNVFLHSMSSLNDMLTVFDKFKLEDSDRFSTVIQLLEQVKNYDDYTQWRKDAGRYVSSKRIARRQTANKVRLEDFFI